MLAVDYIDLVYFICPEPVERRFHKQLNDFFFCFSIHGDPCSSCFHAHGIMIDSAFIDENIYIVTMFGEQFHELIADLKVDGNLVFGHG